MDEITIRDFTDAELPLMLKCLTDDSVPECYGGPLDTDKAVDDEGILAYTLMPWASAGIIEGLAF